MRTASIRSTTQDADIALTLDLDGTGQAEIDTGIGFLDHMLTAFTRHGLFDLTLSVQPGLEAAPHATLSAIGAALGQAIATALADKRGITRFGHAVIPMDEALAEAAIDCSGRFCLAYAVPFPRARLGDLDTALLEFFFRALATDAALALHLTARAGTNAHHIAEAAFKATARALRQAVAIDPAEAGNIPSTKGAL